MFIQGISEVEEPYTSFNFAYLDLQFDNHVVHTKEMLAYDFSNFLIDIGSSLGLWFGLSVFGLADLVVRILQFANKIRIGTLINVI